jgi:hypothetical protein
MDFSTSIVDDADVSDGPPPAGPLLAGFARWRGASGMPEDCIEAPDGEVAWVYDLAAYLRAGQTMAPKLHALYRLWDAKRDGGVMPRRRDFALEELGPWLGHLVLVDLIDGGQDFSYRVFGTKIAEFLGQDLTGKRLSGLQPALQRVLADEYHGVMAARRAHYVVGSPFVARRSAVMARAILPLSDDGRAADRLLIGFYPLPGRS